MDSLQATTQQERLVEASKAGDVVTLRASLKSATAQVDAVDEHGRTPLHWASFSGHYHAVELLLKAGANLHTADKDGRTPLFKAAYNGHLQVADLLLKAGADLRMVDKHGGTPLHKASSSGHWQVVELLLNAGANLDSADEDGWTPLHNASSNGRLQVVDSLLKAGADLHTADKNGYTPLHKASFNGRLQVVEVLLDAGADANATDKLRRTPLHTSTACKKCRSKVVYALLASGADIHAKDINGREPLHLLFNHEHAQASYKTLEALQALVSYGATWDATCDEMVANGTARGEAPALRICLLLWAQEHATGLSFTEVPIEVVRRDAASTQAYIDDRKTSREIVLRRKICLVGPSCAGKTSFVKSITSQQPQLVHLDDRTIGIDHFPLRFPEDSTCSDQTTTHEVTFWDFAGQDAYQAAHALFFSPRTMFLVCVDLEAFTTAFLQASIMSDMKKQETQLMGEFIERTVMRWVRMILARQPDAEFVFIATKEDLLDGNHVTERLLKNQLKAKLLEVERIVHKMKSQHAEHDSAATETAPSAAKPHETENPHKQPSVLFVSSTSFASTQDARTKIEELVVKSGQSFQMPDSYSRVLEKIVRIRKAAKREDISTRITRAFTPFDSLPAELNIGPDLCRIILQTLHDLGDVLWYQDLGVELFQNTVILDPLLLIDFIRQVFNHENTGQIMAHADLKALPYWSALGDDKQMKAMKQVLQAFHLVYSDDEDGVMEWDSDLIVPAFWQTKTPAAWLFLGDILRINSTQSREGEAVRIHWEYHFEFGLPSPLFDHLIVASVSPYLKFDAGPDWIMYKEDEIAACRIMVGRDPKSLHRTIHVEAVVAVAATAMQVENLWESFQQFCGAFVKVLGENPGLRVSSFAWNDKHDKINLKRLVRSKSKPSSRSWMPPAETWDWFKRLMTEQD